MKNKLYQFTHWAAYLTMIHGALYFGVKYFLTVETEYGPRPHYLQSYAQSAHIILSPLFIFAMGLLWKDHIVLKFKTSAVKRLSGISLGIVSLLMIVSGYGIQSFYGELLKNSQVWLHLGASFFFVVIYMTHHWQKK